MLILNIVMGDGGRIVTLIILILLLLQFKLTFFMCYFFFALFNVTRSISYFYIRYLFISRLE